MGKLVVSVSVALWLIGSLASLADEATSVNASKAAIRTGYAPVNGLQMYYEIHGEATDGRPPLVLLHGGGDTIGTSFGKILPELARTRQIIAFEQQGYGHTADIADRPFTFEQSADDTAALLKHLKVEQADLFGFSNGGTIALQVAIRHPEVVRKLVVASAFYSREGGEPAFWEFMKTATLENMPQELQQEYLKVAPHPENLRMFHDKAAQRMRDFKDIPDESMRGILAPTLVVAGDADVVRPEHAVATFRILPHSKLAIVPNADHGLLDTHAELLIPMIESFLDAEAAKR